MKLSKKALTVLTEAKKAYCDSDTKIPWEIAERERSLDYCASESVTRNEAIEIFKLALCGNGYNNFVPILLSNLPSNSKIKVAREGSVCVYVTCNTKPNQTKLLADELDKRGDSWRIWWD